MTDFLPLASTVLAIAIVCLGLKPTEAQPLLISARTVLVVALALFDLVTT